MSNSLTFIGFGFRFKAKQNQWECGRYVQRTGQQILLECPLGYTRPHDLPKVDALGFELISLLKSNDLLLERGPII